MIHKTDSFVATEHARGYARAARRTDLEEFVKEEGEPVGEHLLCNRLRPEETSKNRGGEKKKQVLNLPLDIPKPFR